MWHPNLMVLACAVLLSPVVQAAPQSLTEAEFLARVERAHPGLPVLAARLEAARAEVQAARSLPNPTVSYEREQVSAGGRALPEDYVRVVVPLDLSGRRRRRIEAAETGVAASGAELERQRLMNALQALDLFHDAAHVHLRSGVLRGSRTALAAVVERVRSRAAAGDVAGYDVARLELELGDLDDTLRTTDREQAALNRAVGLLAGLPAGVEVQDPLALPKRGDSPTAERSDVTAARLRTRQGQQELAAAGRAWVPTFEATGGFKSSTIGDERANGFIAGVAARLPLFEHGQAERARAEARRAEAEAESQLLQATVPASIASARESLDRLLVQADTYARTQGPRADDLVRRAETLYREGERPVFELIDAYRVARQTHLHGLDLRREAKRSEVELWRALGRRP